MSIAIVRPEKTDDVLLYKRHVARYLYVERNLSANHTAKEIGMSQTSVSKWVKKLNWNEERLKLLNETKKPRLTFLDSSAQSVDDLRFYLKAIHPEMSNLIDYHINEYIKLKGN